MKTYIQPNFERAWVWHDDNTVRIRILVAADKWDPVEESSYTSYMEFEPATAEFQDADGDVWNVIGTMESGTGLTGIPLGDLDDHCAEQVETLKSGAVD